MTHRIAVAAYNGLLGYEYAIVCELFGLDRPSLPHVQYELVTCAVEGEPIRTSHGLTLAISADPEAIHRSDTVIVPGWRDVHERPSNEFLDALRAAHKAGSRVVAICTGAFVLAHAGLLDTQRVTTHWLHTEAFRATFPYIELDPNPLYIIGDNNTATSAGSSAGLDLCLALIAADHGTDTATRIAHRMVVTNHRPGTQTQFMPSERTVVHTSDQPISQILEWIDTNIDSALTIDVLADRAGMSRRTFIRRFDRATATSPHAWLTDRRVAQARVLLETTRLPLKVVARQTGLGTPANLRKHLMATTGLTPSEYRSHQFR